MTWIKHDLRAHCRPERLWRLLADLEAVASYNPTVKTAEILGFQRAGVGAQRSCELIPKGRVVERVTHWEEGQALGLELAESDWPLHFMRWVTRLEREGETTRIRQELEYKVKFGPLGWLLDALVLRAKLTRTLDRVLESLVERAQAQSEDSRNETNNLGRYAQSQTTSAG